MDSIKCPIVKSDSVCYWKDMWQKLDRMRQLWQLCDVSLVTVDNRMFMAHSPVLAASSNTLHDILIRLNHTGSGEETQKKVFLQNVTSDVLEVTLNFIYGITPLSRLSFERLQVGAKELGILGAYEYCCHQLKKLSIGTSETTDKSLAATTRGDTQQEHLISYQWQIDELSGLNDVDGEKCKFALDDISQSTYQASHTEMGSGAAHGINSIVCWPVNEHEPVADDKISGSILDDEHEPVPGVKTCENPIDKLTTSVSSSASDADNCQPSILNGMPPDDIHTAMFTQMSLVDLTAGVKCPHIKGIIGENNPMDSFLVENELVEENYRSSSLQADESDFDETPTLEERSLDFAIRVPLKKRRRVSVRNSDNDDEGAESTNQSYVQVKSREDNNLDQGSDFLDRNASASSKDSSSHDCSLSLLSSFGPSDSLNSCSSTRSSQAKLQKNFTRASKLNLLDEGKPQNLPSLPSKDIKCVLSVCDSERLHRESMNLESPPDFRSSFHSFTPSTSHCCHIQNIQTDSVSGEDLPTNQLSFNIKNSLISPGMVSNCSDNVLVNKIPSSSGSVLNTNTSRAASAWQDGFASLEPCFTASNNADKLNWQSMSTMEPICSRTPKLNQELASNLDATGGLDLAPTCEPKLFTSLNTFSKHGTSRSQRAVSSSKDMNSTLAMHEQQIVCFSTLGPCQGIAPNALNRNQPVEICPAVADVSIASSTFQSSDDAFPKEFVSSNYVQEGYATSSSPELKGCSSDLLRNGRCDLCDKVFKNISQLNGHRKRMHLQKTTEASSADDKSASVHQCQYCQESFRSSYKLQTHQLKVHSKGKLFSCQDCSFRSPRKKDVQAHMLSQHGRAPLGVKVYSCSSCNYKCIDRNRFEEHEAKHTGITSHRCPLCSRAYTTKRGMRTHIKYHSEERPHKCNICGAAFKVTSKLSDHMKLIHIQKGVKPYKCGYCDHATALRGNCNQHIRKNHPGQPLFVIDKFAAQRKCVKDYDYAGIAGEGIEEHGDFKAVQAGIQSSKLVVL